MSGRQMHNTQLELPWYFDYISPFAYLQWHQLRRLPANVTVSFKPVLFAGMLKHYGNLGPVEIPQKRIFVFRYIQWVAQTLDIEYRTPPAHPFNPLPALRLSIVLGNTPVAVEAIFRAIWVEGVRTDQPAAFAKLAAGLGVTDAAERIGAAEIKDALRRNTEDAIARGVFGVPTFLLGEHLFWGFDSFDFLLDCLTDPGLLDSEAMRRATTVPVGIERRR